jgi:hypothetical protein
MLMNVIVGIWREFGNEEEERKKRRLALIAIFHVHRTQ